MRRGVRRFACGAPAAVALALVIGGCGPPAPACVTATHVSLPPASASERPIEQSSPGIANLARQYQPTLIMSRLDRFWPVSVAAVLNERDRADGRVMLVSGKTQIAAPTLANLKPPGTKTDYLDYPANLADKVAQMRVFLRAVNVPESRIDAWPTDLSRYAYASAQIYVYDAGTGCSYGGQDTKSDVALQYWFFYALNYYPMTVDTATMLASPLQADTADVDFHEGDWEHVTVLLARDGSSYTPKFVWMARHSNEGKLIPWSDVERDATGHPIVYPAFGGHPSYPSCGAHARNVLAAAVYDYALCGGGVYRFDRANTNLVDLAQVSWSCWRGHFGTTVGTTGTGNADDPTGQILVAGPPSPLRQLENNNVCP